MALSSRSKFYYGWKITSANRYLDFNDGTNTLTAILDVGYYSANELKTEITSKMNNLSAVDFTVSFNRATRAFTISAATNFSLLFSTGTYNGFSVASLIGFAATNRTGNNTYTSTLTSGSVWSPQFILQSYKPTSNNRKAIEGVVNKSASGVVEVVKYGNERFMECESLFITNVKQNAGSIVESDSNGVEDYISFIEYATDKGTIEFMPDSTDVESFQVLTLESTEQSTDGLNYELIELYDRGLAEYYRSGKLKFRLME